MKLHSLLILITTLMSACFMSGIAAKEQSALDPDNPITYLRFAESTARESDEPESQQLATQSALIGASLAIQNDNLQLAASCVIAAAEFAYDEDHTALWDLAVLLDPSRADEWESHRIRDKQETNSASSAILFARYEAEDLSDASYTRSPLRETITRAAIDAGYDGEKLIQSMQLIAQRAREDSCNGRIFLPKRDRESGQIVRVLCPNHSRPIGALDSDEEFMMLLRTEMALLNVHGSTWAPAQSAKSIPPLRDPSLEAFMDRYRVSASRPHRNNGRWSPTP